MPNNEPEINSLYKIFPNADIGLYKHYLVQNKGNVEDAIYSYGLYRWEFKKYKKEISKIKIESKNWWNWHRRNS